MNDGKYRNFVIAKRLLGLNAADSFWLLIILDCAVRHYFALATNSGEQFNYFVSLAAWLLRNCGRKIDQPQEVCFDTRLIQYCNSKLCYVWTCLIDFVH